MKVKVQTNTTTDIRHLDFLRMCDRCGYEPTFIKNVTDHGDTWYYPKCVVCNNSIKGVYASLIEAADVWNKYNEPLIGGV